MNRIDIHLMTDSELDQWCAELDTATNDLYRAWPVLDKLSYETAAERVSGYAVSRPNRCVIGCEG